MTFDVAVPWTGDRMPMARRAVSSLGGRTIGSIVAVAGVTVGFAFPFVVMVLTAFKPTDEVFRLPPQLLPRTWTVENFRAATEGIPFWRYVRNTLFVSACCVTGSVVSCPLVGYSLAKLRWAGQRVVFATVLATMMVPPQVTLIPLYLFWDRLGLVGSYAPLIVPTFLGTPFFIFLARQFMMKLPDDLLDAARLDGASELRIYVTIVLPLARPVLATIAVFQFVWTWTDFLNPLIYLNDERHYTLSIGLYRFFSEHGVDWGPLMAASVLFALPAFAVFMIGQRYFVDGIVTTGFK
jgi:multiple sugar transport system permease protein